MTNTVIQIKRSVASNSPNDGTLEAAELAYSFLSDKLFTGNSSGTGIIEIGGKYWTDATTAAFLKANNALPLTGGTITGDLSIVGNLFLSGNTSFINVSTFTVSDPLIYLASNNYTSDIVDIGFIASYVNTTGQNVHTGLFRDHTTKEYYLFQGYDKEPLNNHIDPTGNNITYAFLNADIRANSIFLKGQDVSDLLDAVSNVSNAKMFSTFVVDGTSLVADQINDTMTITSANGISLVADAGADSFIIGMTATGVTPSTYGSADKVGVFTVNEWGRITSASNASISIDASAITSGNVSVSRGGTGIETFTQNGILFGNTTNALQVTSAGTEGQVLQASSTGIPGFAMLDGGSF
jgi:hypothetical protein